MKSTRSACAAFLMLCATSVAIHAIERRPLPMVTLTAPNGTLATSDSFIQPGSWLLIYVSPGCRSCDAVLGAMPRADFPSLSRRVVVVVAGATAEQAQAIADKSPELADAQWFRDPERVIAQTLKLASTPTVLGLRKDMIEWGLTGVFRNGDEMRSVLASWLTK